MRGLPAQFLGAFASLVGRITTEPPRLILLLGGFFVTDRSARAGIRGITALFGGDVVSGLKDLADFGIVPDGRSRDRTSE